MTSLPIFFFYIKNGKSEKSKQNKKIPAASVSAEFKLADSSLHWEAENDSIIKISWTRQKSTLFGRTVMKVYREKKWTNIILVSSLALSLMIKLKDPE